MARPTLRIFFMTTAGVLFAGGVAAAATGNNAFSPLLDVARDPSPTTTVVETDADAIEVDPSDGLSPEELEIICAEASNHGEAVSAVAHDKTKVGAEHGAAVSAMAQSDCGKKNQSDDDGPQSNRGQSKKNKNGNAVGS